MQLLADQDGTSNVETGVKVATFHTLDERHMMRTHDSNFVRLLVLFAPQLLQAAKLVADTPEDRVSNLLAQVQAAAYKSPHDLADAANILARRLAIAENIITTRKLEVQYDPEF